MHDIFRVNEQVFLFALLNAKYNALFKKVYTTSCHCQVSMLLPISPCFSLGFCGRQNALPHYTKTYMP